MDADLESGAPQEYYCVYTSVEGKNLGAFPNCLSHHARKME